jgi:hypothetical protein
MKPTKMVVNTQTQEISIVEMNDEEYAQHLIDVAAWEAQQAQELSTD